MTERKRGSWRRVEKPGPSPPVPPNLEGIGDTEPPLGGDTVTINQGDADNTIGPPIPGSGTSDAPSPPADYTATINWGDGITSPPVGPVVPGSEDGDTQPLFGAVVENAPYDSVEPRVYRPSASPSSEVITSEEADAATINWGDGITSPPVGPVVPGSEEGDTQPLLSDYGMDQLGEDGSTINDNTVEIGGGAISSPSYPHDSGPREFHTIALTDVIVQGRKQGTPGGGSTGGTKRPRPSGRTLGATIGVLALVAAGIVGGLLASSGSSGSRGKPSESPSTTTRLPASVGAVSTTTTSTHPTTTTSCPVGVSGCSTKATTVPTHSTTTVPTRSTTPGATTTTQPTRSTSPAATTTPGATTTTQPTRSTTTAPPVTTTTTTPPATTPTTSCPLGAIC